MEELISNLSSVHFGRTGTKSWSTIWRFGQTRSLTGRRRSILWCQEEGSTSTTRDVVLSSSSRTRLPFDDRITLLERRLENYEEEKVLMTSNDDDDEQKYGFIGKFILTIGYTTHHPLTVPFAFAVFSVTLVGCTPGDGCTISWWIIQYVHILLCIFMGGGHCLFICSAKYWWLFHLIFIIYNILGALVGKEWWRKSEGAIRILHLMFCISIL